MGERKLLRNWLRTKETIGDTNGVCAHVAITGLLPEQYGPGLKTWLRDAERGQSNSKALLAPYIKKEIVSSNSTEIEIRRDDLDKDSIVAMERILDMPFVAGIVLAEPSRVSPEMEHAFSIKGPVNDGRVSLFDNAEESPVTETTTEDALQRACKLKGKPNALLLFKGRNWPE